jgi:DNA replication protein DnaC
MIPLTYSGDRWKTIFRRVLARIQTGCIIALIGPRGTGKTQMAIGAIREAAEREISFRYCTAMDIFLDIKDSYRKGGSERDALAAYTKPSLLVVDEMQERGETAWEDRLLTHILDKRYANLKDTILISNQIEKTFLESVGPSVASRISETGGIAVCDWESFREGAK